MNVRNLILAIAVAFALGAIATLVSPKHNDAIPSCGRPGGDCDY